MRTHQFREALQNTPVLGTTLRQVARVVRQHSFSGSMTYWERRYASGGASGDGSTGRLAAFKAEILNDLVSRCGVISVVEFGCGDGQQLELADYPRYLGLDVAPSVLSDTIARFANDHAKSFMLYHPRLFSDPGRHVSADMAISLDVIYHLVEDDLYELHLSHVFGAASRLVALYTSDLDRIPPSAESAPHVRHRAVARDVAARFPQWRMKQLISNRHPRMQGEPSTSFADFLIYEHVGTASGQ